MAAPLMELLERNLAAVYGPGMAPYVIRRAMRHQGVSEDRALRDREVRDLLAWIRRTSLQRIYGGRAIELAAEIDRNLSVGGVLTPDQVNEYRRGATARERVRELL